VKVVQWRSLAAYLRIEISGVACDIRSSFPKELGTEDTVGTLWKSWETIIQLKASNKGFILSPSLSHSVIGSTTGSDPVSLGSSPGETACPDSLPVKAEKLLLFTMLGSECGIFTQQYCPLAQRQSRKLLTSRLLVRIQ
jgi:hypothetical protein